MKLIRPQIPATPFIIADSNLTSSNVAEAEYTAYSNTGNNAVGDIRQVVSPTSTITMTIASPCVVTWTGHQLPDNTPIRFTTTGALPTGITSGQIYYVKDTINNNTFYITNKPNGAKLNTSGTQSGTHTAVATRHDVYEALAPSASFTATIATTVLTVSAVATGSIVAGMTISGTGVTAGTYIVNQITGTAGSTGTYTISTSQTVSGATAMIGTAPVTNSSYWIRSGSTNRWSMHDSSVSSQTSNVTSIANVYQTYGLIDSVALLNISAATIQVTMTDATDGLIYNKTYSGIANENIIDMYSWYFEPIVRITDLSITDMPQYAGTSIAVTLTDTGSTVLCGACVIGKVLDIGYTQYGMGLGIQDYSIKQRDSFGNYSILERAYNKRVTMSIMILKSKVDAIINILSSYRALPTVYIGSNEYNSSIVLGFYKDFNVEISYPELSLCTIEIEGLI
jgi:hypothetical protein